MQVRLFDDTPAAWDEFVRSRPEHTHFHSYGWRDVMEDAFGHGTTYLGAYDGDRLAGVLPLVRVKSLLFGDYLVSMPFLNYGGPLGDEVAVRALTAEAVAVADREGVKLLELRSRTELPIDLPASHRKVTVLLDLEPGDSEHTFSSLKGKVRSQVRRPMKEGIEVRFGPDQLDAFYRVFAENMRDLGTPVLGRPVFEAIRNVFGDSAWFGAAWLDDAPVAAGCGFQWADEFEMTWASSLRAHSRVAPNMLLYWRFIERAAEQRLRTFNFGRCTPGGGTHRFKLQWGGRDEPLWWYHRPSDGGETTPNPDEGALALGPKVWRKLPLVVANAIGPGIVRNIP
ncbi:MAG: FemAB family PEP-CTERM system-associated protein [Gemmatimonadota bacterium]